MENGKKRYELLSETKEKNVFNQLVYSGIISFTIATWFDIYERYLFETKSNKKSASILATAEYFKVSERNVYRIIDYMER
jgi:hypothetical protein